MALFWNDKQPYDFQDNWEWIHLTQDNEKLTPDICKALHFL